MYTFCSKSCVKVRITADSGSGVARGVLWGLEPPLCLPTEWAGLGYQQ